MQSKFNVGDNVVVLLKKQYDNVIEVLGCSHWPIPTFRYKIATDLNNITTDECYIRLDKSK